MFKKETKFTRLEFHHLQTKADIFAHDFRDKKINWIFSLKIEFPLFGQIEKAPT